MEEHQTYGEGEGPREKAVVAEVMKANERLNVLRMVYQRMRPWLVKMAEKSDTPIDNWTIILLDWMILE